MRIMDAYLRHANHAVWLNYKQIVPLGHGYFALSGLVMIVVIISDGLCPSLSDLALSGQCGFEVFYINGWALPIRLYLAP